MIIFARDPLSCKTLQHCQMYNNYLYINFALCIINNAKSAIMYNKSDMYELVYPLQTIHLFKLIWDFRTTRDLDYTR